MAGLEIHQEENAGKVILRLEGTFDGTTALELRRSLDGLIAAEVVIDFSRVRQFRDLAVAVLSRGLQNRSLRLRGLGEHQERMFRYFGLTTSRSSAPTYYQPEEMLAL
jgi:anti-anti-sigma regulatory factor